MQLRSLYIDFDAFFASVEKQLNPDIRDRPVGVTALDSDYSAFITRCYIAKAAGVKRGMRVRDARALCPDLVVRVAKPDVYVDMHNRILDEIDRHLPVTKVWSIDEMECTLMGDEQHRAREIAEAIRAGLSANIGPFIRPSIGIAPNQFLAKVAAELDKPNGLTVLGMRELPGRLFSLSLTDLPGISENMEKRLTRAGVHTVEDFWNIAPKHARAIWGNIEGERMWAQLRGHVVVRPETRTSMFGHSRVLTKGWHSPQQAVKCLNLLTVKAAYRLRRADYLCGAMRVGVKLRNGKGTRDNTAQRLSAETSFAHCQDDPTLLSHMHGLFERIIASAPDQTALKSVSVVLHHIVHPAELTGDLFADSPAPGSNGAPSRRPNAKKWDKVMSAMDELNKKNGKAVVHIGARSELPGGYAGGKIAFGRVPDKEDFY